METTRNDIRRPTRSSPLNIIGVLLVCGIIGGMALFLRFDETQSAVIAAVPLVLALLLALRRSPFGSWRMLLGVGCLALVGGMAWRAANVQQPTIPDDLPSEVLELPSVADSSTGILVPANAERVLVFYSAEELINLTFSFEQMNTFSSANYWASNGARAILTRNGSTERFEGLEREPSWPDPISDNGTQIFTPTFNVDVRLNEKDRYSIIDVTIRMNVTYLEVIGDEFQEKARRLTRDFQLYVAAPQDLALRQQYNTWRANANFGGDFAPPSDLKRLGVPNIPGSVLAAVVGVFGLWQFAGGFLAARANGFYGALPMGLVTKVGIVVADTALIRPNPSGQTLPWGVILTERPRPNTPAAAAQLQAGDIITRIEDQEVDGHRQFLQMVNKLKRGESVTLTVYREGRLMSLSLML
jgi:hypothetical protein